MHRFLSIKKLVTGLFFCGIPLLRAQEVAIHPIRHPGGSLDASIRNEVDHAIRSAADWLIAQQRPDGSWGSTNVAFEETARVCLALSLTQSSSCSSPIANGMEWLDAHPIPDTPARSTCAVWRVLAWSSILKQTPEKEARLQALTNAIALPPEPGILLSNMLIYEAHYQAGSPPGPFSESILRAQLNQCAKIVMKLPIDTETFWALSHYINQYNKGIMDAASGAEDWRDRVAQSLINTQRKAPADGGFWDDRTADLRIRATAFGLLALLEL